MEEQKPVLLTVSFGTSYNDNRDLSIGAVETALADAYPEYEVRRAFTAQIVIDILEDRDGHEIDNVEEAMERLVADGVKEVVVMPTHVMNGFEYDDIVKEVGKYADKFDSLKIGTGLLTDAADYEEVVKVLAEETAAYNTEKTAVVFMGHGTHHEANATYTTLQEALNAAGYNNYFVGTVEGAPLVDEVLAKVDAGDYDKVVLLPLMIVAGDHANNDMAGDEEDSWKTVFANAGYEVECVLNGLGQYEGIRKMIVDHAGETIAE
ncbi:MAG: sirohydrochlorin cobaltochelatase [Firmicutes bacterium]|nr:sirohydrochlorin cobaltochelatase [Bacillota bacterium]